MIFPFYNILPTVEHVPAGNMIPHQILF